MKKLKRALAVLLTMALVCAMMTVSVCAEGESELPDSTPTDTPADPTPTDAPADPTPTDTPADPTPTDAPADSTPTNAPADSTPTDAPADPTPTETPEVFLVCFGDGELTLSQQNVTVGERALRPEDPTKDGCIFVDWLLDGESYDFGMPVTGHIFLEALWQTEEPQMLMAPMLLGAPKTDYSKQITVNATSPSGITVGSDTADQLTSGVLKLVDTATSGDGTTIGDIKKALENGDTVALTIALTTQTETDLTPAEQSIFDAVIPTDDIRILYAAITISALNSTTGSPIGLVTELGDSITVSFAVPAAQQGEKDHCVWTIHNGTPGKLTGTCAGGFFTFTVDQFSPFILCASHTWGPYSITSFGHSRVCTVCTYAEGTKAHIGDPCSACGYTTVPCATHTWDGGTVTTAATCFAAGVRTYTCTKCLATTTAAIARLSHAWDGGKTYTLPTCTADGSTIYTCTLCSSFRLEPIKSTGHQWNKGVITIAPTQTSLGVRTYTCTLCGALKAEYVPYGPSTGIDTHLALWAGTFGASTVGFALTLFSFKRRKRTTV